MHERSVPTLADAQRQVWVRRIIGSLLIGLTVIFLVLYMVKGLYQGSPNDLFFSPLTKNLRGLIDPLLRDWPLLALLWQAIPASQSKTALPTDPQWEFLYVLWGALVVIVVGGLLLRSARRRHAQIADFRLEMEREAWRQQARETAGGIHDYRGPRTVIQQGIWYEFPAPRESWSQTTWGVIVLGLIVALVGGLVVGFIQLYWEYAYFQGRWFPSRN
jgi:hypothetical protein